MSAAKYTCGRRLSCNGPLSACISFHSCTLLAACISFLSCTLLAQEQPGKNTWELAPYRIKLLVAIDEGPSLSDNTEQDLASHISVRASAAVGGSWQLTAAPAPVELRYKLLHSLSKMTAEDVSSAAKDVDKVMLLAVVSTDSNYQVRAREFDVTTRLWNTVVTREARQAGSLPSEAFRAVLAAFAPLARIEQVERDVVMVRLRAGAIPRRDATLPAVMPGTVFRPLLAKSDTLGNVKPGDAELIPWTYLVPTKLPPSKSDRALVSCRLQTSLSGSVIPEYHPHRQRWAIGVSPSADSTRVKLVSQASPPAPLEGYEVVAEAGEDAAGKPVAATSLGRSGRDGIVTISPGPLAARMLLVRHGDETLARLPLVPGLAEEVEFSLPDDGPRLAVETEVSQLQDEIIDLLTRRDVLATRLQAANKAGDSAAAGKVKEQIRKLPPLDKLTSDLDQQQQAVSLLAAAARPRLLARLADLRKLVDKMKSENPETRPAAPKPPVETKAPETKAPADTKAATDAKKGAATK